MAAYQACIIGYQLSLRNWQISSCFPQKRLILALSAAAWPKLKFQCMKITRTLTCPLTAGVMAILILVAGCADHEPVSPPPGVAVVGFVPDYCFWDGYEYVGWDGFYYYYWAPSRVWLVCDPVRVRRVNVWVRSHPDWRIETTPKAESQLVKPNGRPIPPAMPAQRHLRDHDHDD